ncbi:hypothetical protein LTR85_005119 [Meristemomyces frigidus]|nr:hypothetical protein LTR85_005119 [Meristemomyces frigidus]
MATTCHFRTLPRELRDEIYKIAHREDEPIVVSGDIDSKDLADLTSLLSTPNVMPRSLCASVAVSREYLSEALPLYIRINTFSFATPEGFRRLIDLSQTLEANLTSVIVTDPTDRKTSSILAQSVNCCPRLKHVTVRIDSIYITAVSDSFPATLKAFFDLRRNEELAMADLHTMCGIEQFKLEVKGIPRLGKGAMRKKYRGVEESIRDAVTKGNKPPVCARARNMKR